MNGDVKTLWSGISDAYQAAKKDKNKTIGPLIRKLRLTLGQSQAEFAAHLGISVPTVIRWEDETSKNAPPFHRLQKLRALGGGSLDAKTLKALPADRAFVGETSLCVRSLEWIRERQTEAMEVWLMKVSIPFLSGWPGNTRDFMIDLLHKKNDLSFFFLFRGDEDNKAVSTKDQEPSEFFRAKYTFVELKKDLYAQEEDELAKRLHGWSLNAQEAHRAGLGANFVGTVALIYRQDAVKKHGRRIDILHEIPIARCDPTEDRLQDGEYLCWIQLSARHAQHLWKLWEPVREKVQRQTECCGTKKDTEKEAKKARVFPL
jgi:transcriptional regulator with XRE-family HTH domain